MRFTDIKTERDALAYFLDAQLATVESMAMKKSRAKGEYERQIGIAQKMISRCLYFGSDLSTTRGYEVCSNYKCDVESWAESYEPKK